MKGKHACFVANTGLHPSATRHFFVTSRLSIFRVWYIDFSFLTFTCSKKHCQIDIMQYQNELYWRHLHKRTKVFHCSNCSPIVCNKLPRCSSPASIVVFSSESLPETWILKWHLIGVKKHYLIIDTKDERHKLRFTFFLFYFQKKKLQGNEKKQLFS